MKNSMFSHGLQLRSLVKPNGELEIALHTVRTPEPDMDEVIVKIQATPINPSDIGLLFGAADLKTITVTGPAEHPLVKARVPESLMKSMSGRIGEEIPVGNEGAGMVVAAGTAQASQSLLGKTVAVLGGAMYSQYRCVKAEQCLVLPEGATPAEGASSFVNPLTALGMVETMRRDGHTALVHTAAASSLGQMLNRICIKDGVDLVNIVRTPEQVRILKDIGAKHVCDTSSNSFIEDLTQAIFDTAATIAFDATGGGKLAGQILTCMETSIRKRNPLAYSRYGSNVHKQVYIYGNLESGPTEFNRSFGLAWGVGGWLLFPFLERIGVLAVQRLKERVAAELRTTFVSNYTKEISLVAALQPEEIEQYSRRATGTKYLINPSK